MPQEQPPHTTIGGMLREHTLAMVFMAAMLFALVSIVWLFATLARERARTSESTQLTHERLLSAEEKKSILENLAAQGFDAPEIPEDEKVNILAQLANKKAEASERAQIEGSQRQPLTEEEKIQALKKLQQ